MATIVKGKNANKPWTVRYYHDNRQRERSFATAREARDFKVKFEHDNRAQTFVDPAIANEKFSAVAERWLARHPAAPRTLALYDNALRRHVLPAFGNRGLNAVAQDREGVEHFLRSTLPGKGLGASSVRICQLVISSIVGDAIKSGRLSSTRLKGIKLPPAQRKAEIPFASARDILNLALFMPERYGLTVYLMRGCGLRAGEALGVRGEDFQPGGATLRLSRQMLDNGTYGPLKHRRDGEHRDVPVPEFVLNAPYADDFEGFEPVWRRTYQRWFNAARDKAGLPANFTPHTLRHQFASATLAAGVPITDLAKWLGHQNIQVTYGIYGHLVPESWERAREALDQEWAS